MTRVEVKNGNIEYALKRFKLKVQRSGVPSEMKKRKEYSKPGVVRREAKKEAIKNGVVINQLKFVTGSAVIVIIGLIVKLIFTAWKN